jgi:hypothetical protein
MYEPTRRKPDREYSDWKPRMAQRSARSRPAKGPATEADRPPPSTFPGRPATVLAGQLSLRDGGEVIHDEDESAPERSEARP